MGSDSEGPCYSVNIWEGFQILLLLINQSYHYSLLLDSNQQNPEWLGQRKQWALIKGEIEEKGKHIGLCQKEHEKVDTIRGTEHIGSSLSTLIV